ncbi:TIGR03826 family flagellar region protein [Halobacillus karajensis]|uniref:Flagellar operon protein n=1 Tax=Halobacillus karajensis TaxID=195088 RepID=A0A059NWI0_9BACI|nr:TIGR03826 family flagellar region protein [Halobacillus karajensis]CDQ19205.1 flagellar operon protein [Halobacillus karajensis]CDQ22721.1 flagellar operon protein [Halobacillus karajensis]CDQ26203.1 flagellar operon protein [Halobacillus karajensis]
MEELANCSRCKGLFVKGSSAVCTACLKQEEQDFQTVYTFLRKKQNRTATVEQIEEGTGVSEWQVRQFLKQKRLHPAHFPNIRYGCEKCGSPIKENRLCPECKHSIQKGMEAQERKKSIESRKEEREREKGIRTYYSW